MTGSAIDGDDYTSLSGIIDIPIAATGVTLDLLITNDTDVESVESAILTIDALSGTSATINTSGSSATVTIADNDTTAAVTITATTSAADENGPVDGLFTVSIDGTNTTGGPLTIDYSTTGSATPGTGNDYATLSGTVDILDGSSSATIAVEVEDDSTSESSETVIVTITGGDAGISVGSPSSATVNIADDDSGGTGPGGGIGPGGGPGF
jgi:hypothetical protein